MLTVDNSKIEGDSNGKLVVSLKHLNNKYVR